MADKVLLAFNKTKSVAEKVFERRERVVRDISRVLDKDVANIFRAAHDNSRLVEKLCSKDGAVLANATSKECSALKQKCKYIFISSSTILKTRSFM